MKFLASRLSEGNKIFPSEVELLPDGVQLKIPGLFSSDTKFITYKSITGIEINSPMVGYSSITFSYGGNKDVIGGFSASDAKQIKEEILNSTKGN